MPQINSGADPWKLHKCSPNDRCTPHPSFPLFSFVSFNDQPRLILYSHYMASEQGEAAHRVKMVSSVYAAVIKKKCVTDLIYAWFQEYAQCLVSE